MKDSLLNKAATGFVLLMSWHSAIATDWPQWRGSDRSDRSTETGLLKAWPEGGPKKVWMFENAGIGYAGFSVVKGRVYTMGARDEKEMLIALDSATGKEVWATPIGNVYPNNWGDGPRGTPTVSGENIYALAAQGGLICVEAGSGKEVWKASMTDLGGKLPGWGYCESVLVEGDHVICTPGGSKGAIAALDKKTGKVVWQSKDFTDEAHYSSVIAADHNGVRQLIQLTPKTIVGLNAKDGSVLWKSPWSGKVAVIPTPVFYKGHVFVTSGYGAGCKLIAIGATNEVTDIYENKVMKNHHGGVVQVGDYLYGYSDGPGWICQDFMKGTEVWASKTLGKGAVSYADGMLYCLDQDSGTVALAEAAPTAWKETGRFKLDPQSDLRKKDGRVWTHPVISNGRLYLRDQQLVFCFDVKKS